MTRSRSGAGKPGTGIPVTEEDEDLQSLVETTVAGLGRFDSITLARVLREVLPFGVGVRAVPVSQSRIHLVITPRARAPFKLALIRS